MRCKGAKSKVKLGVVKRPDPMAWLTNRSWRRFRNTLHDQAALFGTGVGRVTADGFVMVPLEQFFAHEATSPSNNPE